MGKLLVAGVAVLAEYGAALVSLLAFLADGAEEGPAPDCRAQRGGGVVPGGGTRAQPLG